MSPVVPVPGSFRDPSGRVYEAEGRILRTVAQAHAPDFEYVRSTGLLEDLAAQGLVLPFQQVDRDALGSIAEHARYVLHAPTLPFISFPYEWSFSALKAAALLHLQIQLAALDRGITLSDASAYNIQFTGPHPVFIDHLSFRRYTPGEIWTGHRQFCEQFLLPLLLQALFGVSHVHWYRGAIEGIPARDLNRLLRWRHYFSRNMLTHVLIPTLLQRTTVSLDAAAIRSAGYFPPISFRRMLGRLQTWIAELEPAQSRRTTWTTYAQANSYHPQEATAKARFVRDFVIQTQPKLLWDLGCNTGDYSRIALEAGAGYAVGFDSDERALELGFAQARERRLAFQSVCMDAANPTPNQGWMEAERPGLRRRSSADAILALAFVHHLVIAGNIPFDQLLDWIVDLAPAGIIEFVPKSEPMVQRLLRSREDVFVSYDEAFFLAHLSRRCEIVKTVSLEPSGRLLAWFRRFDRSVP
ncbi:MAG: class I SAM-dependent methyltransferase [Burkholderiales bacterium]